MVDMLETGHEVLLEPVVDIDVELEPAGRVGEATDEVGVIEDEVRDLEGMSEDIELEPEIPEFVLGEAIAL